MNFHHSTLITGRILNQKRQKYTFLHQSCLIYISAVFTCHLVWFVICVFCIWRHNLHVLSRSETYFSVIFILPDKSWQCKVVADTENNTNNSTVSILILESSSSVEVRGVGFPREAGAVGGSCMLIFSGILRLNIKAWFIMYGGSVTLPAALTPLPACECERLLGAAGVAFRAQPL